MAKLNDCVIDFRKVIESTDVEGRPIGLHDFPNGSCSDASFLLGTYLKFKGHGQFNLISAERGSMVNNTWTTHAWIEKDELIIDITCSQFDDVVEDIIISTCSKWHKGFSIKSTEVADVYERDKGAVVKLTPFYQKLLEILENQ